MKRYGMLLMGIVLALSHPVAQAYDQPAVNLGFTSFLDGAPPAGPGWYFAEYFHYYYSDTFTDADGSRMMIPNKDFSALRNPRLNVFVSLNQLIYQSNQEVLLGGKWGVDLIVPIVSINLDPDDMLLTDNGAGLGDILIGPYLQWDPVIRDGRPVFAHRVELQCLLPTGRYDKKEALNPGSNFFSFNPYWAATWFPTAKSEVSWRIHYLWNARNHDTGIQAGQAIHLNVATSYAVIENRLRVGATGYYLGQISDSRLRGQPMPDSREQVFAVGPAVIYSFSQHDHLFFNAYHEFGAENRPEGQRGILRWVHHF